MNDFLDGRIQERESLLQRLAAEMEALKVRIRDVEVELRAYRDVKKNFSAIGMTSPPEQAEGFEYKTSNGILVRRLRTRLSDSWKNFLKDIRAAYPNGLDTDALREIAKQHNPDVNDDTLRSQLSVYTARNWLERVSTGNYRITESGAALVDMPFDEIDQASANAT